MSYDQVVEKLFTISAFPDKESLGLHKIQKVNALLGHPDQSCKIIHVGGTNGKGSVSYKIAKGLELSGAKVGLYNSPHIFTFRERIKVNNQIISKADAEKILEKLFEITDQAQIELSFFELTTLLAFEHFHREKVDYAVIEVGVGGLGDATNIINPVLSVITSVSLDHVPLLGTTVEEITLQKAGIAKKNVPIVIGPHVSKAVVEKYIQDQGLESPLFQVQGDFPFYLDANDALVRKALDLLQKDQSIVEEALQYNLPGRFQIVDLQDKTIILDVAHNPDGLREFFKLLKFRYPNHDLKVLFGLSHSKDLAACLKILVEHGSSFYPVAASNGRGYPVHYLAEALERANVPPLDITSCETLIQSFEMAIKSLLPSEILVICGSFFIMKEAMSALKINEELDCLDLNEKLLIKT